MRQRLYCLGSSSAQCGGASAVARQRLPVTQLCFCVVGAGRRRNTEAYALFDNSTFELPMEIWEKPSGGRLLACWPPLPTWLLLPPRLPLHLLG